MLKVIIALSLFIPMLAGAAQTTPESSVVAKIKAKGAACLNDPNNFSNMAMQDCSGQEDTDADNELNSFYKSMLTSLKAGAISDQNAHLSPATGNAEILKRLIASEKAWVAFRDTECSFEATEMLGGSGENLVNIGCLADITEKRILQIDSVLSNNNQ